MLLFKQYQVNRIDNGFLLNYHYVSQDTPQHPPAEQKGTRHFLTEEEINEFIIKVESPIQLSDPKIQLAS